MMDTGLRDRIAAKGVPVEETAGWPTRGRDYATYRPRVALLHHTAGSTRGRTPSLATVLYGRPRLPGPLCHVLQSREPGGGPDKAYLVAAGVANHAGSGDWKGYSGNASAAGLEVEHHGTGPVPQHRLETAARIVAAMLEAPGSTRDAAYACQHFEWTSRKIDFHDLAPWTPDSFRARVAYWIGRTDTSPGGFLMALSDKQQDELYGWVNELRLGRPHKEYGRDWMRDNLPAMLHEAVARTPTRATLAKGPDGRWWALSWEGKRRIDSQIEADLLAYLGHLHDKTPVTLSAEQIDSVADLSRPAGS